MIDFNKLEKDLAEMLAFYIQYWRAKKKIEDASALIGSGLTYDQILLQHAFNEKRKHYLNYQERRKKAENEYGYSLVDNVLEKSFKDWAEQERGLDAEEFVEDYIAQTFDCWSCKHFQNDGKRHCAVFQKIPLILFSGCPGFVEKR